MLFGILNLLRMVTTDGGGTLNDFIEFGQRLVPRTPYRDYAFIFTKNSVSHLIFIIMCLNVAQAEERCII